MRSGPRAVYKGEEFEFIDHQDKNQYELILRDTSKVREGFQLHNEGVYVKFVSKDEVENVYYINIFAKYKGHTFPIWEMNEDQLLLGEGDYFIAKEVGFPPSELPWERGLYKKWLSKEEVEAIWEEQSPL